MHVVFGGLVKGWNTLRAIETVPTGAKDKPLRDVIIVDCGELHEGEDDGVVEPPTGELYMNWPEDQVSSFFARNNPHKDPLPWLPWKTCNAIAKFFRSER